MRIFSGALFFVIARLALYAQTLSPNVCAVQSEFAKSVDGGADQNKTQIVVIRGRAVFSPRGFWILTEPGCVGIPLAEALESVKPKVSFQLVKDEKYQELQNVRDRSRHDIVAIEVEGRLDRIGKKSPDVRKGGSGTIHISKYDYMLVLRQVRAVQLSTTPP
jgi:hypothetical protein